MAHASLEVAVAASEYIGGRVPDPLLHQESFIGPESCEEELENGVRDAA